MGERVRSPGFVVRLKHLNYDKKEISWKFLIPKLRGIAFVNARTGGDFQINAAI
jgi:hypothetical protein